MLSWHVVVIVTALHWQYQICRRTGECRFKCVCRQRSRTLSLQTYIHGCLIDTLDNRRREMIQNEGEHDMYIQDPARLSA